MSCDSNFTKSPKMRLSESDTSAPKLEVDCASPIEGKINSYAVNNYNVESDPFWDECDPVSGDEIDEKLDDIFSKKKFLEKTVIGPRTTMSRRSKTTISRKSKEQKQQQRETQTRLQNQREQERLRKLDLINQQGPEEKSTSSKSNHKKIDVIKQKIANTVIKSSNDLQIKEFLPIFDDRRLFNDESFIEDKLVPVKIIPKDVSIDTGEFTVNDHHMMRHQSDGTAFTYGKTQIITYSDVSKSKREASKTKDKFNKRFLSKANFSYDLSGNKIEKMETFEKHESDGLIVLQQEDLSKVDNSLFKNTESQDSAIGITNIKDETNMESQKKQEFISEPSVREDSEILKAIQAFSQQIAELTKTVNEQSKELVFLREKLIEKDNEIQSLKNSPLISEQSSTTSEQITPDIVPQEITSNNKKLEEFSEGASTSAIISKEKITKVVPQKHFVRSKTMPLSKFIDDGVDKKVNMKLAQTPKDKLEVIKNNIVLPPKVLNRAINQEVRVVNSEQIGEKTFAEKLTTNLQRSKSTFSYRPKQKVEISVPRPKGIQEQAWVNILKATPDTLENWEAKRKVKIFEQYKKLFYAQHKQLELRWQEAVVKVNQPKLKNDWLLFPGRVVALLRAEELEGVLQAIQVWRDKAATYVPQNISITADWAKNPKRK